MHRLAHIWPLSKSWLVIWHIHRPTHTYVINSVSCTCPLQHTHSNPLPPDKDGDGSLTGLVKIQQVFKCLCLKFWWISLAYFLCFKLKMTVGMIREIQLHYALVSSCLCVCVCAHACIDCSVCVCASSAWFKLQKTFLTTTQLQLLFDPVKP